MDDVKERGELGGDGTPSAGVSGGEYGGLGLTSPLPNTSSAPLLEAGLLPVRVDVVELREEGEDFTKGFEMTVAVVVDTLKGLLVILLAELKGLLMLKMLDANGLKGLLLKLLVVEREMLVVVDDIEDVSVRS